MRSLATVVLIAGCQCGPPPPAAPVEPRVAAPPANPTRVELRPDLSVPAGPGTPPIKSQPLAADTMARLAKLAFNGFTADVRAISPAVFEVRQLTDARPKLAVTITIKPCFDCLPMTVDAWSQRKDALKLLVDERLRDRDETDFELGATQLAGMPAIFTYQAGQLFETDRHKNPVGTYTDGYALYFNDGVNEMRVFAEYKDDPAADKAAMVAKAPREQLDRIAHAFGDLYVHAW